MKSHHTRRTLTIASIAALILVLGAMQQSQVSAAPLSATSGPNYAGTAAVSSGTWNPPGNATGIPDNNCATSGAGAGGASINLTNFSFSIPAGSTITGILVEPKAGASVSGAAQLLKAGTPVGTLKTTWTPVVGNCAASTFSSLGGVGDTWGSTWSVSDINASNFGVQLTDTSGAGNNNLDTVRITVFYDPPAPKPVRPAEVPEADTLLLIGGGLGGLATWLGWQWRKARRKE
jgi:hypothetical protein